MNHPAAGIRDIHPGFFWTLQEMEVRTLCGKAKTAQTKTRKGLPENTYFCTIYSYGLQKPKWYIAENQYLPAAPFLLHITPAVKYRRFYLRKIRRYLTAGVIAAEKFRNCGKIIYTQFPENALSPYFNTLFHPYLSRYNFQCPALSRASELF